MNGLKTVKRNFGMRLSQTSIFLRRVLKLAMVLRSRQETAETWKKFVQFPEELHERSMPVQFPENRHESSTASMRNFRSRVNRQEELNTF